MLYLEIIKSSFKELSQILHVPEVAVLSKDSYEQRITGVE